TDGLGSDHFDGTAHEYMVDAQEGHPPRIGGPRAPNMRRGLGIGQTRGKTMVGARAWKSVEVAREYHRLPASRMTKPFRAEQGIDLRQPFLAAQSEMGVDNLNLDAAYIHHDPE